MPKLDGYGLLQRIRSSKVPRIRDIPVVVVSGSDEREERERAKAAGATDLITKGIGTAQLLSRLDILSKLLNTQKEFERGLEALVQQSDPDWPVPLASVDMLYEQAETLFANATKNNKNFVVLNVCIGLKHEGLEGSAAVPPAPVVKAVGQLLRRTIRQTDLVTQTADAEFLIITGSINFDAARFFAQRICDAIASAHLIKDSKMVFIASCGLASLGEESSASLTFAEMQAMAKRRGILGLDNAVTGVVGRDEEKGFSEKHKETKLQTTSANVAANSSDVSTQIQHIDTGSPDVATLVQWIRAGRKNDVIPHIGKLSADVRPLVELLLEQAKG
jgi:CheY-like chemotaxis protein